MSGADVVEVELDALDLGRECCDFLWCQKCGDSLVTRLDAEGRVWDGTAAACLECGAIHFVDIIDPSDDEDVFADAIWTGQVLSPAGLAQLQRELEGRS